MLKLSLATTSTTSSLEESSNPVIKHSPKQSLTYFPTHTPKHCSHKKISYSTGDIHHNNQNTGYETPENYDEAKWSGLPATILLSPDDQIDIEKRHDNYKNKTVTMSTKNNTNEVVTKQDSISTIMQEVTPKTRKLKRRPPSTHNNSIQKNIQDWTFLHDSQDKLYTLGEKLTAAEKKKYFSLQLKIGKETDVVLDALDQLKENLGEFAIEGLKEEIFKTINKVQHSDVYKNYIHAYGTFLTKYHGNIMSNATITDNIEKLSKRMLLPFEASNQKLLRYEKEECLEGLLYRVCLACETAPGLQDNEHKILMPILRECKDRLYLLAQEARTFNMAEEHVSYLERLISAIVAWKNKSYTSSSSPLVGSLEYPLKRSVESTLNHNGKDAIQRDTSKSWDKSHVVLPEEVDANALVSDIQALLGVLESDLLSLLDGKCKTYHDRHLELIQVNIILLEGVTKPIKYIPTNDGTSICKSPRPKRHISKRTGSSEEAKETVKIIIRKLEECELVCAPTNKLILEIIDVMTKSPWIRAILTHHGDLLTTLMRIRKEVTVINQNLESSQDHLWHLMLNPTSDQTIQKQFMQTYRNVIDGMTREIGYPAEKLFKMFNLYFGIVGPYQRKQILELAREWLCDPTLRLKSTEAGILEFDRTLVEINRLVEQAKNSKCTELIELVKDFDVLILKYLKPEFKPLRDLDRQSPAQVMEDIANGHVPHYKNLVSSFSDTLKTMSLHHFLQINSSEWVDQKISSESAPHIREMINYSTNLSLWAEETLFAKCDTKSMEHVAEFFIDVMDRLTEESISTPSSPLDYLSAMAIYAVLTKNHIESLFASKHPKLKISARHLAKYKEISALFDFNENFSRLRQCHREACYYVPSMSLLVKDFTITLDSQLKKLFINDKVNIQAIELIGNTALIISKLHQKLQYIPEKVHFKLDDEFNRIRQNKSYLDKQGKFNQYKFETYISERKMTLK